MRLIERFQQGQPVVAGVGVEDVGVAGVHRGNAGIGEGLEAGPAVLMLLHDDRDVAGLDRLAVERGPGGEQSADVSGEVAADVSAQIADRDDAGSTAAEHLSVDHAEAERFSGRRPDQSAAPMLRLDVVDDDARVAQLRTAQDGLQPGHQRGVAAPVLGQGLLLVARGLGGLQIGDDVTAAEGVDRLLRVADQDQRR